MSTMVHHTVLDNAQIALFKVVDILE